MNADEGTQTEDQDTTEDVRIHETNYLIERADITDLSQPYLSNTALVSLALRSAPRTSLHDIRLPRSSWSDFKIKIEAYLLVSFCTARAVTLIRVLRTATADETKG